MRIFLNVVAVLFEGFYAVLNKWRQLIVGMALPFLFYFLVAVTSLSIDLPLMIQILLGVMSFLIFVVVSVAVHRIILLENKSTNPFLFVRFGKREWQFFLAIFEVIYHTLPVIVFLLIPHVGGYLASIVAAYIVSRISLVFPSVAIDAPMTVRASWQATRKYQVLMFTVVFLYSLFFSMVEYVLSGLLKVSAVVEIISLIFVVFLVGALSVGYKRIMTDLVVTTEA